MMRLQELSGGELGQEEGDKRPGGFLTPLNVRTWAGLAVM